MPPLTRPDYNSPSSIRAFLEERGLGVRKKWGQHFLVNPRSRALLAEALGIESGDEVWEIGPGLGAMTALLLERGARVTAFEIDPGFASLLEEFFGGGAFTLVRGDVMKTWKTRGGASPFLLGNLPYTIAAALMAAMIENGRIFRRMVITVQKEVALRMAAKPGSAAYSSISVLCASAYTVRPLLDLGAASFYPRPRVDSAALVFEARGGETPRLFFPLTRALFAARRKTAANNLENFLSRSAILNRESRREFAAAVLERCGVKPKERAENLGVQEFAALALAVEELSGTVHDHSGTD